jgi:Asp-tRNA(Asn)/Glu-tRNA(Gln) amidotransferase C subunit
MVINMTIDREDLLGSIMESLDRIKYIKAEDIPNIDLYMDQVTTFMESHLKSSTRKPGEDKILTKTMINNYTKNDLLPPPVKKKYSREHVLLLIFIYYYKGILSISDIQKLMQPITEDFFETTDAFDLEKVYEEVFSLEEGQKDVLKADVAEKFKTAQQTFSDAPEDKQEFLKMFSFISMLSFDVYVKKLLIENLIDCFMSEEHKTSGKNAKKSAETSQNER